MTLPPCKDDNVRIRFTKVFLKPQSDQQYERHFLLGFKVFLYDNSQMFSCSRNLQVTLLEKPKLKRKCFRKQKEECLFHTLSVTRTVHKWRVTWNHVCSLFQLWINCLYIFSIRCIICLVLLWINCLYI